MGHVTIFPRARRELIVCTRADSTPLRPSSNVTSVEMSASVDPS